MRPALFFLHAKYLPLTFWTFVRTPEGHVRLLWNVFEAVQKKLQHVFGRI